MLEAGPQARIDRVVEQLNERRKRRERIVLTNGCFDLLHPGHLDVLRAARALGDCLVVAVNSDASVRALKGPARPVIPQAERMELLAALRWVDYVVSFDGSTPIDIVRRLRPDVYAKGADWRDRPLAEADEVREQGGEIAFLDLVPGFSTTDIIARIQALPASED